MAEHTVDHKAIAVSLIDKISDSSVVVRTAIGDLKRSRGFWAIRRHAIAVLPPLVREIEGLAKVVTNGIKGAEKREIVLEAVMLLIPEPPWMTFFLRYLIGRAIDAAVKLLNDHYGKNWPAIR